MTTPVSLNKGRKAAARVKTRAEADQNAVKFGRTKAERLAEAKAADAARAALDGHKRG